MSCCGGTYPRKNTLEYERRYKPENNYGCGRAKTNKCDQPSLALEDSALWKWEKEYGKVITVVTKEIGNDGKYYLKIEKKVCPKTERKRKLNNCCSAKYIVSVSCCR